MVRIDLKMDNVCVLLATYNGVNYIGEQLNSILFQRGVCVDIYISDDFSTDGTYELLNNKYGGMSNVHILDRTERYGQAGKNFFSLVERVDITKYDYVAFADQDDIWCKDKLIDSIESMNSMRCSGVSSCVTAFWKDGRRLFVDKAARQRKLDFLFESAGPGCTFVLSAELVFAFKTKLIENKKKFAIVYYHDWSIYAFSRANGFKWHIMPKSTMSYRQHESNETGVNRGIKPALARLKKVFLGWYFEQIVFLSNAVGSRSVLDELFSSRLPFFIAQLNNVFELRRRRVDSVFVFLYLSIFGRSIK